MNLDPRPARPRYRSPVWAAILVSCLPLGLVGQVAPAAAPDGPPSPATETVELSPFEVKADMADSYTALNTNSVTRFRAELAKLPVSADVFTETFMEDVAAVSIEEMVVAYGTGTGVGGSNPEGTADANRPGDRASNVNVKIRGLDAGQMRVNSFGAGGIDDAFTTERVDVVRGPQSLLNGGVGGGGVVNVVSKQARFNSKLARVQLRTDSEASLRSVVDYGVGTNRFAVRFSGMLEDVKYSRDFLGNTSQGLYLQLAAQLTANTTLRAEVGQKWSETVNSTNGTTLVWPAVGSGANRLPADPRNGRTLRVLYAQGLTGDILGGRLNWDNIDSLKGEYFGSQRDNTRYEASLEHKFGAWGVLQVAGMYDLSSMDRAETNSYTNLVAPLRNNNPHDEWAIGFQPGNTHESFERRGYRGAFATEFELFGGRAKNQAIIGAQYETVYNRRRTQFYYQADADGNIIVNPAQINNSNIGRTPMPTQWFALTDGPIANFPGLTRDAEELVVNGIRYVRDERVFVGVVDPTPSNPLGVRGTGSFWDQYGYTDSYYAAFSTDWFDDRFSTLAGYRVNNVENKRYEIGDQKRSMSSPASLNLGVNFKLNRFLRPYYGYSNAFNPPDIVQFGPDGEVTRSSQSIGHELGIKFVPQTGFISGSLSVYSVKSEDEQVSIPTELRQDINPAGINGAFTPTQNWINVDRESQGAELILTAQPTRNWRARFTLSMTDGTVGESKRYAIFYNDEFNTDGRGGVTYADGTPLLVAIDPTQNNNPAAPRTQLTIAMMNDPANAYFAVLDPDSGRITNAAALRLNTFSASGAAVGTGRTALPITSHQLNFTDPNGLGGFITVSQEGEPTSGYSKYSANLTNNYTFTEGRLRGLTIGGTVFFRAKDRSYPFTQVTRDANGVVIDSERRMFSVPDSVRVNAVISYKRKLGRVDWVSQINIDNLLDSSKVIILPNGNTGDPRTARYTFEPRSFVWTNTFSF